MSSVHGHVTAQMAVSIPHMSSGNVCDYATCSPAALHHCAAGLNATSDPTLRCVCLNAVSFVWSFAFIAAGVLLRIFDQHNSGSKVPPPRNSWQRFRVISHLFESLPCSHGRSLKSGQLIRTPQLLTCRHACRCLACTQNNEGKKMVMLQAFTEVSLDMIVHESSPPHLSGAEHVKICCAICAATRCHERCPCSQVPRKH